MEPQAARLSLAKPPAAPRPKFVSLRAERRAQQQARHMRQRRFAHLWNLVKMLAQIIEMIGLTITFSAVAVTIFWLTHNWLLAFIIIVIMTGFWANSRRK